MLLKRPMLVCYKMAPLSYAIISRMLKVPYFSLPNLLAGESLVEELVQDAVTPDKLTTKVEALLQSDARQQKLGERYREIHRTLLGGASNKAARAVLQLVETS
jgi:lipid-A-disaccharide synthase